MTGKLVISSTNLGTPTAEKGIARACGGGTAPDGLGRDMMSALVWFRRDLRVHDHPALRVALDVHDRVVPVFCFDDRILQGRHASGPRTQFLLECLTDLDRSLRERGSGLVIRHGPPSAC